MKNTQVIIANAIAVTIIATLFFFALTFVLFNFLKLETSLKDAWSTLGSFFGGITTLVAAYIASKLFNDWKEQHNKTTLSKEALDIFRSLEDYKIRIKNYSDSINNSRNLNKPFIESYTTKYGANMILSEVIRDILLMEGDFVKNINVVLNLTPKIEKKYTIDNIGINEFKITLNEYRKIIEFEYIDTEGVVDERLQKETRTFKNNMDEKIIMLQKHLSHYIIFSVDINEF